jgi:type IV secretory pathway TrbF-like protein
VYLHRPFHETVRQWAEWTGSDERQAYALRVMSLPCLRVCGVC